jgi:cytochrome c oxidase subunit 2
VEFIRHWDDDILEEVRHELIEDGVLTPIPAPTPPSAAGPDGLQLFKQFGCTACHTIEGVSTSAAGPELTHIGTDAGQRVPGTAASDYIEESLLDPGAFVVKGFAPIMSSFESRMSPEELQALVDYLLGLGDTGAAPSPTKTPAATPGPTPAPSPTPTSTASPAPAAPDTAAGKKVFQQLACGACHTVEGISTSAVGPELTHIGSDAGQRVPGTSASDYMEESLLDPGAFVVAGFAPMMPSVDGRLAPEELQALLDFLLSLE